MVVIMAGFNDRRILIPGAKIKLFQSYKVYKLLRLLYAQLLKKLKSIEKHDSEYAGAHAALGVLFQNSGRLAEAEELFRKSIAVDPRGSDAYIKLGILYQDSGRLAEAEELFRKVITCDPGNSGAYMRLGQVCANRGRPAEAEVLLKKAVELAPRDSEAYLSLGKFYQRKNRLAEAEPLLEKTIELGARNSEAYMRLAQLYRRFGRFLEAEAAYKKAAEFNLLESENSITGLADLYWQEGKLSEAEEFFKEMCAKDPRNDAKNEVLYRMLERLYRETKRTELAKVYKKKIDNLESDGYSVVTADNYHRLKEVLDSKGIRLVCVQYPMRSIEPLKKIFQGKEKRIVFVDNESIFRDAVKKDGYRAYFNDMFAGDFGHCTDKGNRLLAENIANTILKEVFHK
jgi:tetratricopeptide (TPR) repeat protein